MERLSDREMLAKKVEIIPVEVLIRNVAAGSLSKRLGSRKERLLRALCSSFAIRATHWETAFINEYVIRAFGYATDEEMEKLKIPLLR